MNINYQETSRSVDYVLCVIKCLHDWIFKKSSTLRRFSLPDYSHSFFSFSLLCRETVDDVLFCLLLCDCFIWFDSLGDEIGSPGASDARGALWWWVIEPVTRWSLNTTMCRLCVRQHKQHTEIQLFCKDFTHHHVCWWGVANSNSLGDYSNCCSMLCNQIFLLIEVFFSLFFRLFHVEETRSVFITARVRGSWRYRMEKWACRIENFSVFLKFQTLLSETCFKALLLFPKLNSWHPFNLARLFR